MKKGRDAGFSSKRSGNARSGPPFQTLSYVFSFALCKALYSNISLCFLVFLPFNLMHSFISIYSPYSDIFPIMPRILRCLVFPYIPRFPAPTPLYLYELSCFLLYLYVSPCTPKYLSVFPRVHPYLHLSPSLSRRG